MTAKRSLDDLALFGGPRLFAQPRHVGRPHVGHREHFLERVNAILDRQWLTNNGPCVSQFEAAIAAASGVRHCITTCNGTLALQLVVKALNLKGEAIIPAFTFVATAHALKWEGVTPVFCDIDPRTHNMDVRKAEKLITGKTTAVIGVHLWGRPCDVEGLEHLAGSQGLELIFDAAHAFGVSHKGKMIGGFGHAEILSFHATKVLNTLEGGAVLTNDDHLAEQIRLMRNFGFAGYDQVIQLGINAKMNEISAAMGLTLLEGIEGLLEDNHRKYERYVIQLEGVRGLSPLRYDEGESNNYQYVVVEVDEKEANLSRDLFVQLLHAENVLARRYFYPGCHRKEPYRSDLFYQGISLPCTERLAEIVLALPTGDAVSLRDITLISGLLRFASQNGGAIRERMSQTSCAGHS